MGSLTSQPYDVSEGKEYAAYLARVLGDCRQLMADKRLPESEGVLGFLDDAELVMRRVRIDTASAEGRGDATTRTSIAVTADEHQRILTMGESLLNLLEILELRKAINLNRTDAVARVANAFREGVFAP